MSELVIVRAADNTALVAEMRRVAAFLDRVPGVPLADVAFTCSKGGGPAVAAFVTDSVQDLRVRLVSASSRIEGGKLARLRDKSGTYWNGRHLLGDGGGKLEHQKKYGAHTFGATEEHFWGLTGGRVEDQAAYEEAAVKRAKHTITQPEKPELGKPKIAKLSLDGKKKLTWDFAEQSTPQLAYRVRAVNAKGKVVFEKAGTRPEV